MNLKKIEADLRYYLYDKKDVILNISLIRLLYFTIYILKYYYKTNIQRNYYNSISTLLKYERDIALNLNLKGAEYQYSKFIFKRLLSNKFVSYSKNNYLESYIKSNEAKHFREQFKNYGLYNLIRIRYPKKNEDYRRQGELFVFKPYIRENEKGVLLIKYDQAVRKFSAICDIEKLAKYYRFVIEPSTCGYQNPAFFLCYRLNTEVIVQSQYLPDYNYIKRLGENFYPIRLGSGDWTNVNLFKNPDKLNSIENKKYDIVMIANWLKWKRHELLFYSISQIKNKINKVALIGYPIGNATFKNIEDKSKNYGVEDIVDFYDRIPHKDVLKIITQSKVGILLSKEEGANRGIYECFFSNVPIILTKKNKGVNRDHINPSTGILSDDQELTEKILLMIQNYKQYDPRKWAIQNTGHINSTKKLNVFIKSLAQKNGEIWTKDIFQKHNSPHPRYENSEDQKVADAEFTRMAEFLR